MTVYAAFNEMEGLDDITNAQAITGDDNVATESHIRAGFMIDGGTADITFHSTGVSEAWFHVGHTLYTQSTGNTDWFYVKDTSGNSVVNIKNSGAVDGRVLIDTANATDAVADGVVGDDSNDDSFRRLDVYVKLDASAGVIRIYSDGVLKYEETGVDTTVTSGVTTMDVMTLGEANSVVATGKYGEIIIASTSTIGGKVYSLVPIAGSTNDWDNGSITDVDETTINDSDTISTTTDNDQFTWDTSTTLSDTGGKQWAAVTQYWRASAEAGAAVQNVTPFLNDTTATSTSFGSSQSVTTGKVNYKHVWNNDPSDASAWTASKINNYEYGLQADT